MFVQTVDIFMILKQEILKIKSGTAFENITEKWVCPLCAAKKEQFKKLK